MILSAQDLKTRYALGMARLSAGRSAEALAIFGALHGANPNVAEVEFQIARIFLNGDQFDRALTHAGAAARLAPGQAAVWALFADATALAGDQAARAAFLDALSGAQITGADRQALAARFRAPPADSLPAHQAKALLALVQAGKTEQMLKQAQALLPAQKGSAQLAALRGRALAALSRPAEAAQAYRAAIALAPDLVAALSGLGRLMLAQGKPQAALHWLDRAAVLKPDAARTQLARGNALTLLRDHLGARDAFAAAIAAPGGRDAQTLMLLAQAEAHLGHDSAAESLFDQAVALAPGAAPILSAKGIFLRSLGRFDEGNAAFRAAITAEPHLGEPYRLYLSARKATADDPLLPVMERRFKDPATSDRDRLAFGFGLAKAHEDLKNYDRVFDYLDPANALVRKLHPYDVAEREDQVARLIEAFEDMDWTGAQVAAATDAAPIFVTGMPRSGTTLVEQIIASHSRVTGAGELGEAWGMVLKLLGTGRDIRPARSLKSPEIAAVGHEYAAMIRARFPGADRITDKSIQTYLTLGLLRLAMPNARFIVVRRDPRDTLLSIYKNVFPQGTHRYAYDQVDLARSYTGFTKMVEFWRRKTPEWFHEIHYEALVADPEPQSRALIAACGLEWQDACLNFHENKAKVETLSVYQVRQPITKSSVKAWDRYGDRLKPMIDQLTRDGHI